MIIFVVENGVILAMYSTKAHAEIHARTVTGSRVVQYSVLDKLPITVLDDIGSDDWESDWQNADTPVQKPIQDTTKTQPSSPRAKSRKKP